MAIADHSKEEVIDEENPQAPEDSSQNQSTDAGLSLELVLQGPRVTLQLH